MTRKDNQLKIIFIYREVISMKDKKSAKIEVRLTPKEKELIKEYAEAHHITISELVRWALLNKMNEI